MGAPEGRVAWGEREQARDREGKMEDGKHWNIGSERRRALGRDRERKERVRESTIEEV